MASNLSIGNDILINLNKGVQTAARAILNSYGPLGFNAILDRPLLPVVTNDGITILNDIWYKKGSIDNLGLDIVWKACCDTNERVGDGTSTTLLYCSDLLAELTKLITAGVPNIELSRALDTVEEDIDNLLIEQLGTSIPFREISTREEMYTVAATAVRDSELAELITDVIYKAGADAVIKIEEDQVKGKTWVDPIDASVLPAGMVHSALMNDPVTRSWTAERPLVFLHTDHIANINQILPALELAMEQKRSIVCICGNFDDAVTEIVAGNRVHGLNACLVRAPFTTNRQLDIIKDLESLTGAQTFGTHVQNPITNFTGIENLGELESIDVQESRSLLQATDENQSAIQERIKLIELDLEVLADDYVQPELQNRIAILSGSVIRVMVGAGNAAELSRMKGVVEDGVYAVQSAARAGIVPGAAFVPKTIARELRKLTTGSDTVKWCRKAVAAAFDKQLEYLAGYPQGRPEYRKYMHKLNDYYQDGNLLNVISGQFEPVEDMTVIEPLDHFRTCMQNAFGAIRSLISSSCTVAIAPAADNNTAMQRADNYWRSDQYLYAG